MYFPTIQYTCFSKSLNIYNIWDFISLFGHHLRITLVKDNIYYFFYLIIGKIGEWWKRGKAKHFRYFSTLQKQKVCKNNFKHKSFLMHKKNKNV